MSVPFFPNYDPITIRGNFVERCFLFVLGQQRVFVPFPCTPVFACMRIVHENPLTPGWVVERVMIGVFLVVGGFLEVVVAVVIVLRGVLVPGGVILPLAWRLGRGQRRKTHDSEAEQDNVSKHSGLHVFVEFFCTGQTPIEFQEGPTDRRRADRWDPPSHAPTSPARPEDPRAQLQVAAKPPGHCVAS